MDFIGLHCTRMQGSLLRDVMSVRELGGISKKDEMPLTTILEVDIFDV